MRSIFATIPTKQLFKKNWDMMYKYIGIDVGDNVM